MRTIHPLLLAKRIPLTYSKPQVIRLTSLGLVYTSASHSSQPTNNNRQALTYAQYDRELLEPDIDIGNQAFSSGNTGPQKRVNACMGHDDKTDAIVLRFVLQNVSETKVKVFRNENEIFLKRKELLENICETKVFSKRK